MWLFTVASLITSFAAISGFGRPFAMRPSTSAYLPRRRLRAERLASDSPRGPRHKRGSLGLAAGGCFRQLYPGRWRTHPRERWRVRPVGSGAEVDLAAGEHDVLEADLAAGEPGPAEADLAAGEHDAPELAPAAGEPGAAEADLAAAETGAAETDLAAGEHGAAETDLAAGEEHGAADTDLAAGD